MAVSLESRAPFLDHRVIEYCWRIPRASRINTGNKDFLKALLRRYVPAALTDRPKMGFGVPLGDWLRGPLKGWAEELLSPAELRRNGLLDPAGVQRLWAQHQSRERDWQFALWNALMLEAWLRH